MPPSADVEPRGKATTEKEMADQLELIFETADSPQGDAATELADLSVDEASSLPKSESETKPNAPTVSMEAVADRLNLMRAFDRVASNR